MVVRFNRKLLLRTSQKQLGNFLPYDFLHIEHLDFLPLELYQELSHCWSSLTRLCNSHASLSTVKKETNKLLLSLIAWVEFGCLSSLEELRVGFDWHLPNHHQLVLKVKSHPWFHCVILHRFSKPPSKVYHCKVHVTLYEFLTFPPFSTP